MSKALAPVPRALLVLLLGSALAPTARAQCGELAKLVAPNAVENDRLGDAVALSGGALVAGANNAGTAAPFAGAAWVFERGASGWAAVQELTASDAEIGDSFGAAVALDASTLLVGATGDDDRGAAAGAVWVFERNGAAWSESVKLRAFDGSAGDAFGRPLVLEGALAAVGAPFAASAAGSVYVFERSAVGWSSVTKLTDVGGHAGDRFGAALALSDRTLVVGAPGSDDGCPPGADCNTGSVLVFERGTGGWVELVELAAAAPAFDDDFGAAVAIDGGTLLVGAPGDDGACGAASCDRGAVYVYERTGGTWSPSAVLRADDAATGNRFGTSVALDGDRAVIGAPRVSEGGTHTGAAYLFERLGGEWVQVEKLTTTDVEAFDGVGGTVALEGATLVLGVPADDDAGESSGAAYVLGLPEVGAGGSPGTVFCFGNGVEAACPCGNGSTAGQGCLHSQGRGMRLAACGTASVSADDLVLTALHCPRGNAGRFFAGQNALVFPARLFDGLVCLGGEGRRFRPLFQVDGTATDTGFVAQDPSGTFFQAGSAVVLQYWSRDVASGPSPCGSGANLSPALGLTLTP